MRRQGASRTTHEALRVLLLVLSLSGTAYAQGKTDIVSLANGNVITGEVSELERGQLEYKTDDAGTIEIEWDKVVSIEAKRQFEVTTTGGQRFLGSLAAGNPRSLVVVAPDRYDPVADGGRHGDHGDRIELPQHRWLIDVGFSYTRSSHVAQLNLNTNTLFRRPAFEARLTGSGTLTQNEDGSRDDRGTIQATYIRYRGQRLFVAAGASLESNESLGLLLRSQAAVAVGPRVVNTNRAQVAMAPDSRSTTSEASTRRARRTWTASSRSGSRTTSSIAHARTWTSAFSITRA